MPVSGAMSMKGLEEYLELLAKAEEDIDQVAASVLEEIAPSIHSEMKSNLMSTSEQWTGDTEATLFVSDVQRDGNFNFLEAGADTSKDPAAFHKEFGTARQAAEPWHRPTFRKLRQRMKTMLKQTADRIGLS